MALEEKGRMYIFNTIGIAVLLLFENILGFTELGCYGRHKLNDGKFDTPNTTSVVKTTLDCIKVCKDLKFQYAGTKKNKCFCSNEKPENDKNDCNITKCTPSAEMCGADGKTHLIVYKVNDSATTSSSLTTHSSADSNISMSPTTLASTLTEAYGPDTTLGTMTKDSSLSPMNCQNGLFRVTNGREVAGVVNHLVSSESLSECALRCVQNSDCTRFSMNPGTKDCLLHIGRTTKHTIIANDWKIYVSC